MPSPMMEVLHARELEGIECLHQWRSGPLDEFFRALDFFDGAAFAVLTVATVWYGLGERYGMRWLSVVLLSALVNHQLKLAFDLPRPVHLRPELGLLYSASPGFPSGAAQTSVVLASLLIAVRRSPLTYWGAGIFILLISLSRVYLGLHFFSDVVGGLAVGLGIAFLHRRLEFWERGSLLLMVVALSLLFLWLDQSFRGQTLVSLLLGVLAGQEIGRRVGLDLERPAGPYALGWRLCIALLGMLALALLLGQWSWGFFPIGLWFSLGTTATVTWFERAHPA